MSTEENKALVRRFFELLEGEGRIPEELLALGFIYHVPGSLPMDLKGFQPRGVTFSAAYLDIRRVVDVSWLHLRSGECLA